LSDENWGWVAGLSLNYKGEYFNGGLIYKRGFTLASGLNSGAEQNYIELSAQHRLTYELSTIVTAGYSTYRSEGRRESASESRQDSFFVNPGIKYEISRNLALEASYGYARINRCSSANKETANECAEADRNADRHLASIRFTIQYPCL
jgi:predicted porin